MLAKQQKFVNIDIPFKIYIYPVQVQYLENKVDSCLPVAAATLMT